jgi:hypothetical protein
MHVQTTEAGNNLHKCVPKCRELSNQRLDRGERIGKKASWLRDFCIHNFVRNFKFLCVIYAVELPSCVELTFPFSIEVSAIFPITSEYRHIIIRLHPTSLWLCRRFKATERKI